MKTKIKRSLALLFAVMIVVMLFPAAAFANSYSLSISGAKEIYSGKTVTYSIKVRPGSGGCSGFQGTLSYDTSVLELKSVSKKVASGWSFSSNASGGSISFVGYDSSAENPYTSTSTVFSVTFNVKNAAIGSTAKVSVSPTGSGGGSGGSVTSTVTKPKSNNNKLKSLSIDSYELSPGFSAGQTTYSLSVPYSVSSVKVKAVADDETATVSISGAGSLKEAATNKVRVTVVAEDGSKKVYTINVKRGRNPDTPKNEDKTLKSLSVDPGTLFPAFSAEQTEYVVYVANDVENIQVNAVANDEWASASVQSDGALHVGVNTVPVLVTAENGDEQVYNIKVIRGYNPAAEGANNATLSALSVEGATLEPAFSPDVFSYTAIVAKDITSVGVDATPQYESSGVAVFGAEALAEDKLVSVVVTAADGTVCVYRVRVDVRLEEANASLSSLTAGVGTLEPAFDPDVQFYTLTLGETPTEEAVIEAVAASEQATVEYLGLNEMRSGRASCATVVVTAQDGTKKVYVIALANAELPEENTPSAGAGNMTTGAMLLLMLVVLLVGVAAGVCVLKIVQKVYRKE